MNVTVTATRAIQRIAAMIEPKISATMRTPMATAANKIPPRMSFKRLRGPGLADAPGSCEREGREMTIWTRWFMEQIHYRTAGCEECTRIASLIQRSARQQPPYRALACVAKLRPMSKRSPDHPGPQPRPDLRAIHTMWFRRRSAWGAEIAILQQHRSAK